MAACREIDFSSQLIMNVKKLIWILCVIAVQVQCAVCNNLYIVKHPPYVEFRATKQVLPVSHTQDLVSTVLGLSTSHRLRWDGLRAGNPFHRPEAVGLVILEGFHDGVREFDKTGLYTPQYKVDKAVYPVSLDSVYNELRSLYENNEEKPEIMNVETEDDWSKVTRDSDMEKLLTVAESDTRYNMLDTSSEIDRELLKQILALDIVMNKLLKDKSRVRNGVGDVYRFDLTSLRDYIFEYANDPVRLDRALTLIHTSIDRLSKTLEEIYSQDYLLLVMTVEKQTRGDDTLLYQRSKRQEPPPAESDDDTSTWNLSVSYDPQYPVVFNIILWTSIVLALALYAVSAAMWDMDPGRESIIYRMTSSRGAPGIPGKKE